MLLKLILERISIPLWLTITLMECAATPTDKEEINRSLRMNNNKQHRPPKITKVLTRMDKRSLQNDLDLSDADILCENIFYVIVDEGKSEGRKNEAESTWVCDVEKDGGNTYVYGMPGLPSLTQAALDGRKETYSGNAQMIFRNATDYLNDELFSIDIPQNANLDLEIEIIEIEETSAPISFPITKTTLVVRVSGSEDKEEMKFDNNIIDAATLSRRFFGGDDDEVNLKSGYEACSANKFIIEKASGYDPIVDGVLEVRLDISTSQQALKPLIEGTNPYLENEISQSAKAKLGTTIELEQLFDFIIFCLPEGTNVKTAYARIGGKRSVYNNDWCLYPSVQMHEIGHNMRLYHSNENGFLYDDQSGLMGYSYPWGHEFGKICFNGVKSWLLGWYQDKQVSLNPDPFSSSQEKSWNYKLVGVIDYQNANQGEHLVNIQLEGIPNNVNVQDTSVKTNYYFQYNLKQGPNSETQEFANMITISKGQVKLVGSNLREQKESSLLGALSLGQHFLVPDYKGSGIGLKFKVCKEDDLSSPPFIRLDIFFETEPDPCPEIVSEEITSAPTAAPIDCKFGTKLLDLSIQAVNAAKSGIRRTLFE